MNSLVLIQRTRLIISLDFRGLAKVSLFSVIISGLIGIWLAWLGYGVWALVVQTLCASSFYVILLWGWVSWIPKEYSLYSRLMNYFLLVLNYYWVVYYIQYI